MRWVILKDEKRANVLSLFGEGVEKFKIVAENPVSSKRCIMQLGARPPIVSVVGEHACSRFQSVGPFFIYATCA